MALPIEMKNRYSDQQRHAVNLFLAEYAGFRGQTLKECMQFLESWDDDEDDESTPLIFADWLDDHGCHAWAADIRKLLEERKPK